MQCCDLGYHASLHRALRTYLSAELNVEASKHTGLEGLEGAAECLEPNGDKQKLMETYNNVFCPPVRFDFQSHMGDTVKRARGCAREGLICRQAERERASIPLYLQFCYYYIQHYIQHDRWSNASVFNSQRENNDLI